MILYVHIRIFFNNSVYVARINAPFDTKSVHTDIPLGLFGEVVRKILHNISYLPNIFKETSS